MASAYKDTTNHRIGGHRERSCQEWVPQSLAGLTTHLGRCVNNRDQFSQMSAQKSIVEDPILLFQALQKAVLSNGGIPALYLIPGPLALLVESIHAARETPGEPKGFSLF